MKFTQVAATALIVFAMVFVAGCTAAATAPTTTAATVTTVPTIVLNETSNSIIHYGWGEVKGTVTNNANVAHDVALYVDFYDAQGVKIDHVLDFVSVDAHGTSTFDCTTTKLGTDSAKLYVDHFY